MSQIVAMCSTDHSFNQDSDCDDEKPLQKIDFTQFRKAYVSVQIKRDIVRNVEENRKRKAEHEKFLKAQKNVKKPAKQKKQKLVYGMSVEELHSKLRLEKKQQRDAKLRHLKRAFAGIDRS